MARSGRTGRTAWLSQRGKRLDPIVELQLWAVSEGVTGLIIDLAPYEPSRVAGIVETLILDPCEGVIKVSVADGTGITSAVWPLRRPTPQLVLVPGRAIVLSGNTRVGPEGETIFDEPTYEMVQLFQRDAA